MGRIDPRVAWRQFSLTIPRPGPDWHMAPNPPNPVPGDLHVGEWRPGSFCPVQVDLDDGVAFSRIDPRRSRTSRLVCSTGIAEYCSGPIHFVGSPAKDSVGSFHFAGTPEGIGPEQGFLIAPHSRDLVNSGPDQRHACGSADSVIYDDFLADRRKVYSFISFSLVDS